ncbi:MAG: hypothetical protein ACR2OE_11840 [Thermomicrobiales bacterium]
MVEHDASRRALDIYVLPGCFGYDRARQLANDVLRCRLPGVEVSLIDLSNPATVRPEPVFAVPTYLLNGQVLSLGNPELDWLCHQLTS